MTRHPIDTWIAKTLRQQPPRAKSLVMTVFGDAITPRGGSVWLSSLIALLAPLGISERLVRTSVYRLVDEGWLEASRSGRRSQYRLSPQGEKRFLRAHQRVYAPSAHAWDGRWTLVCLHSEASSTQKLMLKKELLWEGLAQLAPGLFAYPGNKHDALADLLTRTGMTGKVIVLSSTDAGLPGVLPMSGMASQAWSLAEAGKTYRKFIARFGELEKILAQAGRLEPPMAFTLRTLLIHEYRRALLHDPQLPSALLGNDWPGDQAYALCKSLYLALEKQADKQVALTLSEEQDEVPPIAPKFANRFRQNARNT